MLGNLPRMTQVPLPPVVYAPTMVDDQDNTRIRMHRLVDGRVALYVYSAIDRLEEQYGDGAPWAMLSPPQLEKAHQAEPFDLLLLDRELYPDEQA